MQLRELLARAGITSPVPLPANPAVHAVVQDHREVTPGALFVARKAAKFDAHDFATEAVQAGAVAIVAERPLAVKVPVVVVPDARRALAPLAAALHDFPGKQLSVVGVTGTDGKTTVATLVHFLLSQLTSKPVGLLSTAGTKIGAEPVPGFGRFTTPEASEVQAVLGAFVQHGAAHAVVEASSHGFALHRLDEVEFAVGVLTNISPEHLDFHGTIAKYVAAKATLAQRATVQVINQDDQHHTAFTAHATRAVTYGLHEAAQYRISEVQASPSGVRFILTHETGATQVFVPLFGAFNAHNAAAAIAAVHVLYPSQPVSRFAQLLATAPAVPGRMEVVANEPFLAIIDFAHTPPAVETVLRTLREHTTGRIVVVLGAAGERDPAKREPLGRVASTLADVAIFTEEDSRSENVHHIIAAMQAGAQHGTAKIITEPRREVAIAKAVAEAQPGDVVVFLGKGPEATLERANESVPWNERNTVLEAIHERIHHQ